jgi:hypothetical protein
MPDGEILFVSSEVAVHVSVGCGRVASVCHGFRACRAVGAGARKAPRCDAERRKGDRNLRKSKVGPLTVGSVQPVSAPPLDSL